MTLNSGNLLWLQARAQQSGARSISEFLDQIVTDARVAASGPIVAPRSIVGTVTILDPTLFEDDDAATAGKENASTRGPLFRVRERQTPFRPTRRKPSRG